MGIASNGLAGVSAVCGLCSSDCGIELRLNGGRIESVRGDKSHPFTKGYLCPKGRALGEIQGAPDRVRAPLLRSKGSLREVSWEDALSFAAERLLDLKREHGASCVGFHVGRAGIGKEFLGHVRYFSRVFGSPNFSCAGSHCHFGNEMGNTFSYGGLSIPDFGRSDCLVFWGYNPLQSAPPLGRRIAKAVKAGARTIVVDPSDTAMARRADIHLKPRPGTDAALALGMLHVVMRDGAYDQDFVRDWTVGFDALAERVHAYSPERVEGVTGIAASLIEAAARMYAEASPAAIGQGNALELHLDGVQAARAVACLISICGNLDVAGGNLLAPRRGLARLGTITPSSAPPLPVGAREYPLFYERYREAQANLYGQAVPSGAGQGLRGLMVVGSDPLVQWPGSARLREDLVRLDLLVVSDLFLTETARQADLVFPATLPVERDELWDAMSLWGEPRLGLAPKAASADEILSDVELFRELAHRMGYGDRFPWSGDTEALDHRLTPLGLSRNELAHPEGFGCGDGANGRCQRRALRLLRAKSSSCLPRWGRTATTRSLQPLRSEPGRRGRIPAHPDWRGPHGRLSPRPIRTIESLQRARTRAVPRASPRTAAVPLASPTVIW